MKREKSDVAYSEGMLHSHCGPTFKDDNHYCKHFLPKSGYMGECEKVHGKIDPSFWCQLFEKVRKSS